MFIGIYSCRMMCFRGQRGIFFDLTSVSAICICLYLSISLHVHWNSYTVNTHCSDAGSAKYMYTYYINQHSQTYIWTVHECTMRLGVILDFIKNLLWISFLKRSICSRVPYIVNTLSKQVHYLINDQTIL